MDSQHHTTTSRLVLAGLIAGTLDIGAACLINRLGPLVILQAIASGLIGKASFAGGVHTALLGLLLQWAMAILIAALYLLATTRLPTLRTHWRLTGLIAGVTTFLVMNYVVVPLSAAPFRPLLSLHGLLTAFTPYEFVANLIAMMLFGLIIAFLVRDTADPRVVGRATPQRTAIPKGQRPVR